MDLGEARGLEMGAGPEEKSTSPDLELPIEDLVAPAVIGQVHVVLVRELYRTGRDPIRYPTPCIVVIVGAPSRARSLRRRRAM